MTVRATYSDGSDRDVTHLSLFMSNNDNSASITPAGVITAGARGEAFVMARFSTYTVGSQYIVLPKGLQYAEVPPEPVNYVDEFVAAKLKKLRIHPSGLCSDEEFLRRVSIDLVGLLPRGKSTPASRLMPTQRSGKRRSTNCWVAKSSPRCGSRSGRVADDSHHSAGVDQVGRALLSVAGRADFEQRPARQDGAGPAVGKRGNVQGRPDNYYQIEQDRLKIAENTAQIFMGMRIQCAQCHNHPFDRWTQDDYYNFAAFFAQVGRKTSEDSREQIIFNAGGGEVPHPVTGPTRCRTIWAAAKLT